ncbi:hypothetical protein [Streptomyces wuyuanensis]|uniref:hypothetical protein n=1 Tax=Streptomyces wuyuanensis TaxID=1196353 RepID=UPI0037118BE9
MHLPARVPLPDLFELPQYLSPFTRGTGERPAVVRGMRHRRSRGRAEQQSRSDWFRLASRRLPVRAFVGPAGSGKTTLALDATYAGGHSWDPYPWNAWRRIHWISARDEASLATGLMNTALEINIKPDTLTAAQDSGVALNDLVLKHLARRPYAWTLVLDGLDDPELLARAQSPTGTLRSPTEILPEGLPRRSIHQHPPAGIIVTSRISDPAAWGRWITLIQVKPSKGAFAGRLLRHTAGESSGTTAESEALATRLLSLPLALRIAGKHLSATASEGLPPRVRGFLRYESLLNDRLPPSAATRDGTGAHSVITAVCELSLDLLADRGFRRARPLLQLLSRFAPAPVPIALLQPAALARCPLLTGDPTGGTAAMTEPEQRQTIEALRDLGLLHTFDMLRRSSELHRSDYIAMDPAVAEVALASLKREPALAEAALAFVIDALSLAASAVEPKPTPPPRGGLPTPPDYAGWWPTLVPHVLAISADARATDAPYANRFSATAHRVATGLRRTGNIRAAHHLEQAAAADTVHEDET